MNKKIENTEMCLLDTDTTTFPPVTNFSDGQRRTHVSKDRWMDRQGQI